MRFHRVLLALLVLLAVVPAGAAAAPAITVNASTPPQILLGRNAAVDVTVANPAGQPYGYNLSVRDVLPAGISYVAGSGSYAGSAAEPTVYANRPAAGQTTLVWRNLGDLSPGSSDTLSYKVAHATTGPNARTVGSTYQLTPTAYINTNPRTVPTFSTTGAYQTGSTQTVPTTATTTLSAISLDVQEGSPEGELLRGAHDNQTVYTLHLEDNAVGPTGPLTLDAYLPAGLEFLGCGDVDNTTNAPTNPGSTAEYPGSGPLSGHTAAPPNCTLPSAVTTETVDPDGAGPLPSAVYTHLRWTGLAALAAGASRDLRYVAAVPLRENTAPFGGASTANLDNNSGPRTEDEQALPTYAKVTGNYGAIASSATDTETRTAEDLRILKTNGGQGVIQEGQLTRWTLTLDTGEYRSVSDLRVTDTVPDGLCPLDTTNRESDRTADCAPGPAPSAPYTSATENASGTWTLLWDKTTDPELAQLQPSTTRQIAFSTRERAAYQQNFTDEKPVLARDSWTNTVSVLGADYQRLGVDGGSLLPAETDPDGTDDGDVSSSSQSAGAPSIDKQIRASAGGAAVPVDCSGGTYGDAPVAVYGPGDRVCYRLRVDFPGLLHTGKPVITDFLPPGVTYESSAPTAANTVAIQSTSGAPGDGVVSFTLGDGASNADNGQVFEVLLAARVTDATQGAANDVRGNLMKFAFTDTSGRSYPLRDQVDMTWSEAQLTLTEGVNDVNDGTTNPANTDGVTVRAGDAVTIRVDVSNGGNRAATNATVLERLPTSLGVTCAVVSAISDGGTCSNGVITWTGVDVAAGGAKKLTYDYVVPAGTRPSTTFPHTAGVRDYQSTTNAGGTFTYYPASNIDPAVTTTNAATAKDTTSVLTASPTILHSGTSPDITQAGNDGTQATIGERVTYTASASIPAGTTLQGPSGPATFVIPVGSAQTLTGTPAVTLNGSALPGDFTVDTSGNTITVTFPANYVNAAGSGADVLQVVYRATIDEEPANTRGTVVTTPATLTYADSAGATKTPSASAAQTVVEPVLGLAKSNDDADGRVSPGQRIVYTLGVSDAAGASAANDVVLTDVVPAGLTPVTAGGTPVPDGGTVQPSAGTWDASARTITFTQATVAPGATATQRYEVRVDNPAVGNAAKVNTATATATSYPSGSTLYGTERTSYRATASNTVSLTGASLTKSVDAPTATVGQTRTFTLDATIPAGLDLFDVTVRDLLPDGLDYEPGSATATCVGGCDLTATALVPTANTDGSTQLGFFIGDAANAPADRVVRITYRAHVDDHYEPEGTDVVRTNVLINTAAVHSNQTDSLGTPVTTPPASAFTDAGPNRSAPVTVTEPVLAIDKAADRSAAGPGDTVTYTLKVGNTGDATAYDIAVADQPDTELVAVAPAAGVSTTTLTDDWTAADPDLAWTIPSISAGGSVTLTYTAKLGASTGLREADKADNTARVASAFGRPSSERVANGFDYRTYTAGPDTASVDVDLPRVAVALTTGGSGFPESAPAEIGQSFGWRAVISNTSPTAAAKNADLTVRLPVGWTYDTGSASVGDPVVTSDPVDGDLLTWTDVADLAAGGSKAVPFTATPAVAARGEANPQVARASVAAEDVSGATASADGPYAAGPDPAQATLRTPQLTIAKTPDAGTVDAGGTATWTIQVGNTGTGTARTVRVTDVLPAGVRYTANSASPNELSNTLNPDGTRTLVFAVADLAPNAGATITLPVDVPASADDGTRYVNAASVAAAEQPNGPDDTGAFTVATSADVRVSKVAGSARFVAGQGASWTITASNDGPSDARNVTLEDDLPSSVSGASLSGADAGACSVDAGKLTCAFGTLAPGASRTVVVSGTLAATATGSVVNTAHVDTDTPDGTPSNDDDKATTPVEDRADVELTKTAGDDAIKQSTTVTYTLTATNYGPSVARSASVSDDLPAGMAYVSDDAGCSEAAGTVTCDLGTLGVGDVKTVHVVARGVTTGTKRNTATVSTTATDPDPADDTDQADVDVNAAVDLELDKSGPATVAANGTASFALKVTNGGPADATGVQVADTLPAGLSYVSDDGGCSEAAGVVTCPVGALAAGASATIRVTARAAYSAAEQTLTNRATTSADQPELDDTDNDDSADVTVGPAADVRIAKTVDPAAVAQGQRATYTLRVDNDGPSEAKGVSISDPLPAGVAFVSSEGCTLTAGVVTCTIGDLAKGANAAVTVTVRGVDTGTLENTATVSTTTPDSDPSNDRASVDLVVGPTADLSVVKDGPATVAAGETVTYDLAVTNSGPSTATGVQLVDTLPAGLSYVSATEEQGGHTAAGSTVTFALGSIPTGTTVRATVTARAGFSVAGTTVINSATVTETEHDTDPADNTDDHPVDVGPAADVSVTKTAPASAPAGGVLLYTLRVANAGPQAATGVVLDDPLPAGMSFVSATPAQGTCTRSGGTVRCAVGTLEPGAGAQVLLAVRVGARAGSVIRNTATAGGDQPDPTPPNNADDAVTKAVAPPVAAAPDLRISKSVDPGVMLLGRRHGYTITARNASAATAKGVVVVDSPADDMDVVGMTTDQGTCSVEQRRCALGDLPGGASAVVHVVAVPRTVGEVVNHASVSSDSGEGDVESNVDSAEARVRAARTSLRLRKHALKRSVDAGGTIRYVLRARNVGGATASGVRVCDVPPLGMSFARVPGARLSKGRACWTVRTWKAGAARSFRVVARVSRTMRGRMVNRATLTAANAKRRRSAAAVAVRAAAPAVGGGVTG